MAKSNSFVDRLQDLAWEYIQECVANTKEVLSNNGQIKKVRDRHIPTIDYFLRIWIPLNYLESYTIKRQTYYRWLKWDNTYKQEVIRNIDDAFKCLAVDIVANEQKGIFYAKNRLGMSDKIDSNVTSNVKLLSIDPLDDSNDNSTQEDSKP